MPIHSCTNFVAPLTLGSLLAAGSSDGSVTFFDVTTEAPRDEDNQVSERIDTVD